VKFEIPQSYMLPTYDMSQLRCSPLPTSVVPPPPPTADAGSDGFVTIPPMVGWLVFDATATNYTSLLWTQLAGAPTVIAAWDTLTPFITYAGPPIPGFYTSMMQLVAMGPGGVATDPMTITWVIL
jgi:hypothetical protein